MLREFIWLFFVFNFLEFTLSNNLNLTEPVYSTDNSSNSSFILISSNFSLENATEPSVIADLKIPKTQGRILTNRSLPEIPYSLAKFKKPVPRLILSQGVNKSQNVSTIIVEPNTSAKIYMVDFELVVNGFVNFEPKSGLVELDTKFVFKWWDKRNNYETNTEENSLIAKINSFDTKEFYPSISFKDKSVKYVVKNQIHTIDNVQVVLEQKEDTQESLLAKFEKFKASNKQAFYTALTKDENEIYLNQDALNSTNQLNRKTVYRQYSCLEQNATLKFKCKDSSLNSLDTSRFPFDSHSCQLDFDLLPTLLGSSSSKALNSKDENQEPIYLFSFKDLYNKQTKLEIDNSLFEYFYYNKLVEMPNNYSWISREWILKQLKITYKNSSLANLASDSFDPESNEKLDTVLMSRKDMIEKFTYLGSNEFKIRSKKSNTSFNSYVKANKSAPASISLKFSIFRRREPQVYIFVLPLILFTLITFLIFFMPTTNTSEKTLIAFLNFASLLAYNIYLFKLVIQVYEFLQLPLMLQYSNCLMIIQLGVLAYTCFVKSVYHYGFLTLTKIFPGNVDEVFKGILSMNAPQSQQNLYSFIPAHFNPQNCDQVVYHGCEKFVPTENNNNRMVILNKSSDTLKIAMPVIKLDDTDSEAMNGITTIVHDENNYVTYNQIDASAPIHQKCNCTAHETDADCGNNSSKETTHIINGCIHSGSGSLGENNRLVTAGNDMVIFNESNKSSESGKNELTMSSNKPFNSNWIFSKCCGSNAPDLDKVSPSMCEHVRSADMKKERCDSKKVEFQKQMYCISTATTQQLMPEYDYASHLTRLRDPVQFSAQNQAQHKRLSGSVRSSAKIIKPKLIESTNKTSKENDSSFMANAQIELFNGMLGNTTYEISKLNMNMNKLVKFEEIFVREKILKEEWKRKARLCDGICCLLVFFLLVVCSVFIFIILPTVRTASLMD